MDNLGGNGTFRCCYFRRIFQAFNKKFYVPNNAVLVIAGQFDKAQTKEWVNKYFSPIPKGAQ